MILICSQNKSAKELLAELKNAPDVSRGEPVDRRLVGAKDYNFDSTTNLLALAIKAASDAGVVVCIVAGNENQDIDAPLGEYTGKKNIQLYFASRTRSSRAPGKRRQTRISQTELRFRDPVLKLKQLRQMSWPF